MRSLRSRSVFATGQPFSRAQLDKADLLILLAVAVLIYAGVRLAVRSPEALEGPQINLSLSALPYYTLLSVGRMLAAYTLSLAFSLVYGYAAANNPRLERILLPILDVLQSVPILSFLPLVLLGLTAVLPQGLGTELAAVHPHFYQPGLEPHLQLLSIAQNAAQGTPRSRRDFSLELVVALPPDGTALCRHRPALEQRHVVGGRLVFPDGCRNVYGGR